MIAADLPDGSVVASKSIAYIKDSIPGWPWKSTHSTLGDRITNSDMQDWLDSGTATVLRAGAETGETDWQWGVRYRNPKGEISGNAFPYDDEVAARERVRVLAAMEPRPPFMTAELVRRAVGEWRPVATPETGGDRG